MQIKLRVKETVTPDGADWQILTTSGALVSKGVSTDIAGVPTARGYELAITIPDYQGIPGDYTLEVTVQSGEASYSKSTDFTIEDNADPTPSVIITVKGSCTGEAPDGTATLYRNNQELATTQVDSGRWTLDLTAASPSLDALTVHVETSEGFDIYRVYYITPSVLGAIDELRTYLDRLNQQLRIDSLRFADEDYILWLSAGRDMFNGYELLTNFWMTGATGPIRNFWMICSRITALRVRYLEEGLTTFQYGGAAVTLDVDVTQFLDAAASALESQLDQLGRLKRQLHNQGTTEGVGAYQLGSRMVGAVGISYGPATGGNRHR